MGNNSKHKTRKILAATATVTMLATGMIFSSDVFAEQKEQQKNLSTSLQKEKSVKSENRTFTVPGKGDVEVLKHMPINLRLFTTPKYKKTLFFL
ncbi:hypothetical protein P4I23_29000, partial [Bacillus cereus]|nr:hypothetical protein [Bacillus cereus]